MRKKGHSQRKPDYMKSIKKYPQKEQGTPPVINSMPQWIFFSSITATEERLHNHDSTDDSDSKQCCVCYDEGEETPNYRLAGFQTLYLHFQKSLHQNKSLTLVQNE